MPRSSPFDFIKDLTAATKALTALRAEGNQFTAALKDGDEARARRIVGSAGSEKTQRKLFFEAIELVASNALARQLAKELLANRVNPFVSSVNMRAEKGLPPECVSDPMRRAMESGDADLVLAMLRARANLDFGASNSDNVFCEFWRGQYAFPSADLGRITDGLLEHDKLWEERLQLGEIQHSAVLARILAALDARGGGVPDNALEEQCSRAVRADPECVRMLLEFERAKGRTRSSAAQECGAAMRNGNWGALGVLVKAGLGPEPDPEGHKHWHYLAYGAHAAAAMQRDYAIPAWVTALLQDEDPYAVDSNGLSAVRMAQAGRGWETLGRAVAAWSEQRLNETIAPATGPRQRL